MASDRFQTLIFDLDDTLIPTSELLVPQAVRKVFQTLTDHGLKWDFETFEQYRKKHIIQLSHREIIREIIKNTLSEGTLSSKGHIFEKCIKSFYETSLPETIPLLPGASENLKSLSTKYKLFLLSAGDRATQEEKIIKANLQKIFHEVAVADDSCQFDKKKLIAHWIEEKKLQPQNTLSIGNRMKDEIRASKLLHLSTCLIRYGEHADEVPHDQFEKADFEISHHSELIAQCRL